MFQVNILLACVKLMTVQPMGKRMVLTGRKVMGRDGNGDLRNVLCILFKYNKIFDSIDVPLKENIFYRFS